MASCSYVYCSSTISNTLSSSITKLHHPSPVSKPIEVPLVKKEINWASLSTDVEAHINQAMPRNQPAVVFEPMHYLTFAPPRSMAPALCIAACETVGGEKYQAIAAASALHLMHAAAFTHENLPLSRRPSPKPTGYSPYSANIELLTGDGILPFGYELLAKSGDSTGNNSAKILRVIVEIAQATGSQGAVAGQYQKICCMGSNDEELPCEVGWIQNVCKKKEGAFYACGAACGAILGGGSDEEIEILRSFGLVLGTMHGNILHGIDKVEKKWVQGFRCLALQKLESLEGRNVEIISALVDECFETLERV